MFERVPLNGSLSAKEAQPSGDCRSTFQVDSAYHGKTLVCDMQIPASDSENRHSESHSLGAKGDDGPCLLARWLRLADHSTVFVADDQNGIL